MEKEQAKGAGTGGEDNNKLVITACVNGEYEETSPKESYEVLTNPEEFQESVSIQYDKRQATGTNAVDQRFDRKLPPGFSLKLLFDSTGILKKGNEYITKPVMDQISEFKKIVLDYDGKLHQPRFVKLVYGQLMFKGRLEDLDITYTLFNSKGKPVRARATALFTASAKASSTVQKDKPSSPDLTHSRVVKAGDTLPEMTRSIYGDDRHYLQVAKHNRLKSFRKLQPGTTLFFPPLN